ncbi:MAG: ABC transporter ATP-binding protein [Pseudomonadota bacterium]
MATGITVRCKELYKTYGVSSASPVAVLRDVKFTASAGEFVVLLGRSGSGKTTFLNVLGGLEPPDRGEVELAGHALWQGNEQQRARLRRAQLGFVFQSFNLIPTLTVAENLMLPLALNDAAVDERAERVASMLDRLGLHSKGPRYPSELSGGEQQRVAVGRALIHQPALVIADEPTGNLDLETARQVLDFLQELVGERGVALVMATHSAEVMGRADRVCHLQDQQIVDDVPA